MYVIMLFYIQGNIHVWPSVKPTTFIDHFCSQADISNRNAAIYSKRPHFLSSYFCCVLNTKIHSLRVWIRVRRNTQSHVQPSVKRRTMRRQNLAPFELRKLDLVADS